MALVGSFHSRPHAEMAAAMLAGHGIRAAATGDDANGVAPHWTFATSGGYAISVADSDRDAAIELLAGDGETASTAAPLTLRRFALHAVVLLVVLALAAVWLQVSLG